MNSNTFRILSVILKVVAIIIGVFGIYYGLILGVFGAGPDGPGAPMRWRLLGLAQLLLGALYLVPNSKLTGSKRISHIYIGLCVAPVLVIIAIATISISRSSLESFMNSWGLVVTSTYLAACLFAPLSLIFSMLGARQEKAVSRPEEPVSCSGTVGSSSGDQSPERSDGTTVHSHKS